MSTHAIMCEWRKTEDNFRELFLSYNVSFRDQTHFTRLTVFSVYLLDHLTCGYIAVFSVQGETRQCRGIHSKIPVHPEPYNTLNSTAFKKIFTPLIRFNP